MSPTITEIVAWVRSTLGDDFAPATNGVWRAGDGRVVRRLGVAHSGKGETAARAARAGVDALLLHWPWYLGELPPDIGVLVFHEALDERLTTGENPWLAERLGFTLGRGIGVRRGRPLVSLAHRREPLAMGQLLARVEREFSGWWFAGWELWNPLPDDIPVDTIALANAMRPALVALAAHAGATLYLTGTLRAAARPALEQTPMAALGLGHRAIEQWGLHWLARSLYRHFGVEIVWLDQPAVWQQTAQSVFSPY